MRRTLHEWINNNSDADIFVVVLDLVLAVLLALAATESLRFLCESLFG